MRVSHRISWSFAVSVVLLAGCDERHPAPADGGPGAPEVCDNGVDDDGDGDTDCEALACAARLAEDGGGSLGQVTFAESVEFLWRAGTGPCPPLQHEVASGALDEVPVAVLRGRVDDERGVPLRGARVAVLGRPEVGYTRSRGDGLFDLVVPAGLPLTVTLEAEDRVPAQRTARVVDADRFVWVEPTVLAPRAVPVRAELGSGGAVRAERVEDESGARRLTALFAAGTRASAQMEGGGEIALPETLSLRITEATVGALGPARMPADLPPATGYTYAFEIVSDEAEAMGAEGVRFDRPVPLYVENFLDFPVGTAAPLGYYDRQLGRWVPERDGVVLAILSEESGLATLDTDGDGRADGASQLAELGVDEAELRELARLYEPGQELWRVSVEHFSTYDINWPFGFPTDGINALVEAVAGAFGDGDDSGAIDEPSCAEGSVIRVEPRTLAESAPVPGTSSSLVAQTDRLSGFVAGRSVRFRVTPSEIPASLREVRVVFEIAGVRTEDRYEPAPDLEVQHLWDGRDAYGRTRWGSQPFRLGVGYVYQGEYATRGTRPSDAPGSFGEGGSTRLEGNRTRQELVAWTYVTGTMRHLDARAFGLGGFSLSSHHALDTVAQTVEHGDGTRRSARSIGPVIDRAVGGGREAEPGGDALDFDLNGPRAVAAGPRGEIYVAVPSDHRVYRVEPSGRLTLFAGNGSETFSGDGGPAAEAGVPGPADLAVGPDGSVYVASSFGREQHRIRRVRPDGVIETFAGVGRAGDGGDGGPAIAAELDSPAALAVDVDGTLYFADGGLTPNLLRAVMPDGRVRTLNDMRRVRVDPDGQPVALADFGIIEAVAVGPDGSIFVGARNAGAGVVFRVGPDRVVRRALGTGELPEDETDRGSGGPGELAQVFPVVALAVGSDGSIYASEGEVLWHVDPLGIAQIVNPDRTSLTSRGDGGPLAGASFVGAVDLAVDGEDRLWIVDRNPANLVRVARSPFGARGLAERAIPRESGQLVDVFDAAGRHLRTVDAHTGAVRMSFEYDGERRLARVIGTEGNVLEVEREGGEVRLVAPFGEVTRLFDDDGDGYADRVAYEGDAVSPASTWRWRDDLLAGMTDRHGVEHAYRYDALGLLLGDGLGELGEQTIERTEAADGYTIVHTSAGGRAFEHGVRVTASRAVRTLRAPDGSEWRTEIGEDWSSIATEADGTTRSQVLAPHPVFGEASPFVSSLRVVTPAGRVFEQETEREASATADEDALSSEVVRTTVAPGTGVEATRTASWDRATRTWTIESAEGRRSTIELDELGRIARRATEGLHPVVYERDARGRPLAITVGEGALARSTRWEYEDGSGRPSARIDADGARYELAFDALGRLERVVDPEAGVLSAERDDAARTSTLSPPGRGGHEHGYDERGALALYTPPDAPAGGTPWSWDRDADGIVELATLGDGRRIELTPDVAGRPEEVSLGAGRVRTTFGPGGRMDGVAMPGARGEVTLGLDHDGPLLDAQRWSGAVEGAVRYAYDAQGRVDELRVEAGGTSRTIVLAYDLDGALTRAGDLEVTPDAQLGYPRATSVLATTGESTADGFGELDVMHVAWPGGRFEEDVIERDGAGRIRQVVERTAGGELAIEYAYDALGRLVEVRHDGALVAEYGYDANGNRTFARDERGMLDATFDAQDRLTGHGGATYAWNGHGQLVSRTEGASTTRYAYDELGNLMRVELPDGRVIEYAVDGMGRRVARFVDGALDRGWLYRDGLEPIAELDATGAIASVFVYGTSGHVPDLVLRGGRTYRVVSDHLGSVLFVVDAATGAVAQALRYDAYGRVLEDSAPGFQPFALAGGLYDADTGLVRFGARDYDPETGRWTAKDPILFAGGQGSLYAYASGDPVNLVDLDGHLPFLVPVLIGAAFGAASGAAFAGPCDRVRGAIVGAFTGAAVPFFGSGFRLIFALGETGEVATTIGGFFGGVYGNTVGQAVALEVLDRRGTVNGREVLLSGVMGAWSAYSGGALSRTLLGETDTAAMGIVQPGRAQSPGVATELAAEFAGPFLGFPTDLAVNIATSDGGGAPGAGGCGCGN